MFFYLCAADLGLFVLGKNLETWTMTKEINSEQEGAPIWRLGFRPFFLSAALFALVAVLIWLGILLGAFRPVGFFDPILWHAHEMIYGYATAVIAGFVLTASQNWTGRRGVHGRRLWVLVLIWIAGRVLISALHRPSYVATAVDLLFYPSLALAMVPYLKPADMKIERIFFAYFALYFTGNLLMHLDSLGILPGQGMRGALLGLNTTIVMIVFMGGRVIPFFTESELSRHQPKTYAQVEGLAHVTAWAFLLSQLLIPNTAWAAWLAFAATVTHLARLAGWQVRRIRRIPVLWILHLAYFWIAVGFGLFGLASLGRIAIGPAVHALAIGALGGMTYGMMSRVSLGHTGRKLQPSSLIVAGYIALNAAAVVRVLGPLISASSFWWMIATATTWVVAFALFIWVYAPMLLNSRVDGRPG
jgi:uncharacterized protein involved in response to NO